MCPPVKPVTVWDALDHAPPRSSKRFWEYLKGEVNEQDVANLKGNPKRDYKLQLKKA